MKRVLFVCLGNICRSPMAEAIFNRFIETRGLGGMYHSDSAGTQGYHTGSAPDKRTLEVLRSRGIPVNHKARKIGATDFADFDFIVAMDESNLANLNHLRPGESKAQVMIFRDYETGLRDVPDPYYGNPSDFEEVYQILDQGMPDLLERFRRLG